MSAAQLSCLFVTEQHESTSLCCSSSRRIFSVEGSSHLSLLIRKFCKRWVNSISELEQPNFKKCSAEWVSSTDWTYCTVGILHCKQRWYPTLEPDTRQLLLGATKIVFFATIHAMMHVWQHLDFHFHEILNHTAYFEEFTFLLFEIEMFILVGYCCKL